MLPGEVAALRRQRLVKAAEPLAQRGLTRFQLSQMLEEKTKAFKDIRARLRLVLERKPRILPPVKVCVCVWVRLCVAPPRIAFYPFFVGRTALLES